MKTNPSPPDWRGLCEELRNAAQLALTTLEGWANYDQWVWPISAMEQAKRGTAEALSALKTALSRPAPAPAEEVSALARRLRMYCTPPNGPLSNDPDARWLTRAADLLERQAAPVPVAVSEMLPGDQLCWWFEADEDCGYGSNWTLLRIRGSATGYTHWLPAHALPLPSGEVEA